MSMTPEQKLEDLENYEREESTYPDHIAPDGCYFCGSLFHSSDSCMDIECQLFFDNLYQP